MTGISLLLDDVFYQGVSASSQTPRPYPVSINGRGYVPDFSFRIGMDAAFRQQSIDMLRPQADTSNLPGQQSLNPYGLWRRSQETWHGGAGQSQLDRESTDDGTSSVSNRFRASKGINVWNKWEATLLNDTFLARSSSNQNLACCVAGTRFYAIDGQTMFYGVGGVSAPFTTDVTGTPAASPSSICTDGYNVYAAYAGSGLYGTNTSTGAATQVVTTALAVNSICRSAKGRLFVSNTNSIYNVTAAGPAALPTALLTQNSSNFVWVDVTEGPANIYLAGRAGNHSTIYRTAVKADGTALDTPQVAGELPYGEIINAIKGYLGFLIIGSNLGVRFSELDSSGNLILGDLIPTEHSVLCFEPQDRFVWFGWSYYDSTSSGLGRLDLRTLNGVDRNVPAYASDLMATAQGDVSSVVTFGVRTFAPLPPDLNFISSGGDAAVSGSANTAKVFAVQGAGFYSEDTVKVPSGTIDAGLVAYGIADKKVAAFLHLDFQSLAGTIQASMSQDDAAFAGVGTASDVGSTSAEFSTNQTLTNHYEVRVTLSRSAADTTVSPSFQRWVLKVNPAAATGYLITVPVRLHETLLVDGVEAGCVPSLELGYLDEIRLTKQVVTYQVASSSYTVTVESVDWFPSSMGRNNSEVNGIAVVGLKTLQ